MQRNHETDQPKTALAAQKALLNRLGLTLPQRLRYLEEVAQM